jgi:hypothetical protein
MHFGYLILGIGKLETRSSCRMSPYQIVKERYNDHMDMKDTERCLSPPLGLASFPGLPGYPKRDMSELSCPSRSL